MNNYLVDDPQILHELQRTKPGVLTLFVANEDMIDKVRPIVQEIAFSLDMRIEVEVLFTELPGLQWSLAIRRVSALDPQKARFAIVSIARVSDPAEAGRYLRSRLFNVIDDSPETIEYFTPPQHNHFGSKDIQVSESRVPPKMICEHDLDLRDCPHIFADESNHSLALKSIEELAEKNLENEKKQWIDALSALIVQYMVRFNETPPMSLIEANVRGKILLNASRTSPIVVSGDMKIYLPELNEIQLRMTPLATTVYILFLCHPEGIRLKDIENYRHELTEIYSMVKPSANDRAAEESIAELVNPLGNSLQEKMSMTRRAVRRYILDRSMAENYIISGERGGIYRIALDPALIQLPDILKRNK